MIFAQTFDMVNVGLVILDKELKVFKWNRWMESHSRITAHEIIGRSIFDLFPNLKTPAFLRNCKSILAFGNFAFFSQKLHHYLFPFKPEISFASEFKYMQQNCTMGPIRDENNEIKYIFISVYDVTEVASYEQKLLEMGIKDNLTGIFNRRFLEKRLKEEFARHKRHSRPLSLIILDIDLFKKINDNYGHQCGDFILKAVSGSIVSCIRESDILARYGGEEFCCLLTETCLSSAVDVAERCRNTISKYEHKFNDLSIRVTISLGVSGLEHADQTPDILIKRADAALYEAKKTGRNKVVSYTDNILSCLLSHYK